MSAFTPLPTEIHDAISNHLDLANLRELRLTSREVSRAFSGSPRFKSFYLSKTVMLSPAGLANLERNTRAGCLGSLMEDLTLVGPLRTLDFGHYSAKAYTLPLSNYRNDFVNHRDNYTKSQAPLLACFRNILANSRHGCIRSIRLKVDTVAQRSWAKSRLLSTGAQVDPWEEIWESARCAFFCTMRALADSRLPLEALDLFFSITRCSLSCEVFSQLNSLSDLATSLGSLKKLSLGLSRSIGHQSVMESVQNHGGEIREDGLSSAVREMLAFLRSCHSLEELELHWYNTGDWEQPPSERQFFEVLEPRLQFPRLQRLTLENIATGPGPLSNFIRRHQITHLRLIELRLGPCSLSDFFDKFRHQLQYLTVAEIFAPRLQLFRNAPGRSPIFTGSSGVVPGPHAFTRMGEDAKLPVEVFDYDTQIARDRDYKEWVADKELQYGPPR